MSPEPYLLWRCQLFSSSLPSMKISRCYPLQPDHYPGIHSQWGLTLELILSHLWHQPCVFLLLLWLYHEDEVPLRSFSFQMLLCVWVLECVFVCVCVCVCVVLECVCVCVCEGLTFGQAEGKCLAWVALVAPPEVSVAQKFHFLAIQRKDYIVIRAQVGKEFPDMRKNEKWIEFVRMGEDIWRAGRVKGELSLLRVNGKFL